MQSLSGVYRLFLLVRLSHIGLLPALLLLVLIIVGKLNRCCATSCFLWGALLLDDRSYQLAENRHDLLIVGIGFFHRSVLVGEATAGLCHNIVALRLLPFPPSLFAQQPRDKVVSHRCILYFLILLPWPVVVLAGIVRNI